MAFLQKSHRLSASAYFSTSFSPRLSVPRAIFTLNRSLSSHTTPELNQLFEYTSGRWIWNDASRHTERIRVFNVLELKRLAAAAVNQNVQDVVSFEKLAEGGFNRTFLITMRDGFQFVGRVPYTVTEPKNFVIASEVATVDYLRSHNIPVPQIFSYSASSENAAGTEYIFMELVRGTSLGDIWFDLSGKAMITVLTKLVELESKLFSLEFPASGSLYYTKDLQAGHHKVVVSASDLGQKDQFCIGPDTRLNLWHGKRLHIETNRGPYMNAEAALTAGAKKEIAYLTKYGRLLYPFHRLRRETYDYKKQSPSVHVENLEKYLQIASYLIPNDNPALCRPTIRHPDFQPNNILVSEDLEITGVIDWQHCVILPLFLQCGIPNSFQNYGDTVSESLVPPELPPDFDGLSEREKYEQVQVLRRRQLHYFYVANTEMMNPLHYDALSYEHSVTRRKIFDHASSPWEGDNVTLKADLIHLVKNWTDVTANSAASMDESSRPSCPILFTEDEMSECLRLNAEQIESDEQLQACRDAIGVGSEGWVPLELYDETKQRENKLRADALEAAESEEERAMLREHWVFGDFDEEEYL